MSQEIVPVDPTDVFLDMDPILPEDSPTSQFTRPLAFQEQYVWEPYDSEKLPETLASEIQRFLRVANLVESEEPRVAYLCRFYTFEEAHRIDRSSNGRGVRRFKDSLLRGLEKDDEFTSRRRKEMNDTKELKRVYHAYKEYIIRHDASFNLDNSKREKLINARRIASVLYEIFKKIDTSIGYASPTESIQLNRDEEIAELLNMDTSIEETNKIKSDETFADKKPELIVEKCKALEDERLTQMFQGDDSVQSEYLTRTEKDDIYKEEVQIKKDKCFACGSMEDNVRPSTSAVPSLFYEDKYLETQEKLNKVEKKIEEMGLKLKDVDFWTIMMQNMFPDQVPPSIRANPTENNNNTN
ncbi:putative transposase Ptta/En/Spm plant [Arabidopsis suecica]|uniref:Putative transposase Ptta/En/Spm plant n=1 Tax=Arabidopsis suecica TaxID=45249 RepID=A0A8T2B9X2_ARASU|nr:putative transposase Ptta/En/Spm plant [Arabidopsis suecica]